MHPPSLVEVRHNHQMWLLFNNSFFNSRIASELILAVNWARIISLAAGVECSSCCAAPSRAVGTCRTSTSPDIPGSRAGKHLEKPKHISNWSGPWPGPAPLKIARCHGGFHCVLRTGMVPDWAHVWDAELQDRDVCLPQFPTALMGQ